MSQLRHHCFEICANTTISTDQTCEACPHRGKGAHGLAWEIPVCKMIISEIKKAQPETDVRSLLPVWRKNTAHETTAIHDITPELMGVEQWPSSIMEKYGHGVSVKLMKIGCEICCADMQRIYKNFTDNWSQIVGLYEIKNVNGVKCYCIQKVFLLRFKDGDKDRRLMFGTAEVEDFSDLTQALKKAKENHPANPRGSGGLRTALDGDRQDVLDKKDALGEHLKDGGFRGYPTPKSKTPILRIRPKIDRAQARLQCAYNYPLFLQLIDYYSTLGQAKELPNAGIAAILYNPVLALGDTFYAESSTGGADSGGGNATVQPVPKSRKQKKGGGRNRHEQRRRKRRRSKHKTRKKRKKTHRRRQRRRKTRRRRRKKY